DDDLAARRRVVQLEVRVGDDRLLEVRVDAGAPRAVRARELDLDARAVIDVRPIADRLVLALRIDLQLFVLQHVGCVVARVDAHRDAVRATTQDRKSTRLNSSHRTISYAVFCLKKKWAPFRVLFGSR